MGGDVGPIGSQILADIAHCGDLSLSSTLRSSTVGSINPRSRSPRKRHRRMPTFTWRLLDQDPTRYDFDDPENHASERGNAKAMSALPPKADIRRHDRHVR